jgi:hypothetical protein
MDKRIELYWVEKYPDLFSEYHVGVHKSPMARGFECGNGWFDLMDQLWRDLSKFKGLVIGQVKEKFACLNVYIRPHDKPFNKKINKLIETATFKSFRICEMCGDKGNKGSVGGWSFTLCERCFNLEENHAKWHISEKYGHEIVEKLELRTTCKTKKEHLPDFNFFKCIVCGIEWRDV